MKRICRLLLLALLLTPALSNSVTAEVADPRVVVSAESPSLPDAAALTGIPEPVQKNHCTAHQYCPNGSQITCTGHATCSVGSTSVTCDGATTYCPTSPCPPPPGDCSDLASYCDCVNSGIGSLHCWRAVC